MRISDLSSDVCSSDLLAEFLTALQRIEAAAGPAPGPHNFHPGGPLATYDAQTPEAVPTLGARIDTAAVAALREAALIGRAACRERVLQYVSIPVVAVYLNRKTHKL